MTNQINNQSIIPSTEVIQLTLTLKMTTAQVVETSVTVNNNSPIQDHVHPYDHTQLTYEMTPGFKPFTQISLPGRHIVPVPKVRVVAKISSCRVYPISRRGIGASHLPLP